MNTTNDDGDVRRDAIVNSACEQVRALLETHFRDIGKAAEDSFTGDETQTEPEAKVTVGIGWPVLSQAAKVAVKIAWSVRYTDETEEEVDPLQSKLDIEPDKELRKAAAKMRQFMKDNNATVKVVTP